MQLNCFYQKKKNIFKADTICRILIIHQVFFLFSELYVLSGLVTSEGLGRLISKKGVDRETKSFLQETKKRAFHNSRKLGKIIYYLVKNS